MDIKCRKSGLKPSASVCVATLKALKYHGGLDVKECTSENLEALENGIENLLKHVENIKQQYGINVVVAINKFVSDTDKEIEFLSNKLREAGVELSLAEVWGKGSEGAIDLAEKVMKIAEKETIHFVYEEEDAIKTKIEKIATNIYGAEGVEYTEEAIREIENIEKLGYRNYPVCIAKTQYSFSDDAKNLECKEPFKIHVSEVILKTGAEFVVVYQAASEFKGVAFRQAGIDASCHFRPSRVAGECRRRVQTRRAVIIERYVGAELEGIERVGIPLHTEVGAEVMTLVAGIFIAHGARCRILEKILAVRVRAGVTVGMRIHKVAPDTENLFLAHIEVHTERLG